MPAPTLNFLHGFPKAEIIDFDLENDIVEFKIESIYDIKLTTDSMVLPVEISWSSNGIEEEFNERFFIPIEDSVYEDKKIFVKCKPVRDEKLVKNTLNRINKSNEYEFVGLASTSNCARNKHREKLKNTFHITK